MDLKCTYALVRAFGLMSPMFSLESAEGGKIDQETMIQWLLDPGSHFASWPVSRNYRKKFWKEIIGRLEGNSDMEVDERIYEEYISLLNHIPVSIHSLHEVTTEMDEGSLVIPFPLALKHLKTAT